MSDTQKVVVNASAEEIQQRVATALNDKKEIVLSIISETGGHDITIRVRLTDVDRNFMISLLVGVIVSDSGEDIGMIDIFIPTSGQPTALIREINQE